MSILLQLCKCKYYNHKFSNSVDPDQTAPRGANSIDPDQTAPREANSVDPGQRSSLTRVYDVCHSICTFWTHYYMGLNKQIWYLSPIRAAKVQATESQIPGPS